MPKTAILTLTQQGLELARVLRRTLPGDIHIFAPGDVIGLDGKAEGPIAGTFATADIGVFVWLGSLKGIIPEVWRDYDAIVAMMALGIVVRLFGPLAVDKTRDPAVVAVDDAGQFAIAVLGGHGAGANDLAIEVADALGAQSVITTASDGAGLPAVDRIGFDEGWIIEGADNLTRVAAAVVRRERIAVWQDAGDLDWWRRFGDWPGHFHRVARLEEWAALEPSATLVISDRVVPTDLISDRTLIYRPPTLVAGIGCKRGTSRATIEEWVRQVMAEEGLAINSLAAVATVMLKADEPGLLEFARSRGLPLVAFPSEHLVGHPGIEKPSDQVQSKVGLLAVAEPAALLAAGASKLLVPKHKGPGVTLALARKVRTSPS